MGTGPSAQTCKQCVALADAPCAEQCREYASGLADPFAEDKTALAPKSPFELPPEESCSSCCRRSRSFFDDDAVILERLDAINQGDRLLAKLGNLSVFFGSTATEILRALLQLTRHAKVWASSEHGRGDLLQVSVHDSLIRHAAPPVRVLQELDWSYRADELPETVSGLARRAVICFFSAMLAAGAAMKFHRAPPPTWKRRGMDPVEVLRGAELRMPEVIAGLRFLAGVALLELGDMTALKSRRVVMSLMRTTGLEALYAGSSGARSGIAPLVKPTAVLKADATWDQFFGRAWQQPRQEKAHLLADLESFDKDRAQLGKAMTLGFPAKPLEALATDAFSGEEEVVFCTPASPAQQKEVSDNDSDAKFSSAATEEPQPLSEEVTSEPNIRTDTL